MNILHTGNKLPVQKGFFKNGAGDLLHTLRFLGRLYHFCNFVIIFSLLQYNNNSFIIIILKQFKYKNDKKQYFTEMLKK